MSWQIDDATGDIVIGGWDKGIGASPHKGLGNIQCADITTVPGEIMCNFGRTKQSQYKNPTNQLNANNSTSVIALAGSGASAGLLHGTWIHITSSTITNISNGSYYYVKASTAGVVTLSTTYEGSTLGSLGVTGTATFDVVPMGKPLAEAESFSQSFPNYDYFVLDNTGNVWTFNLNNTDQTWRMINSPTDTKSNSSGIVCYGGYLLMAADQLYYKQLSSLGTAWAAFTSAATLKSAVYPHYMLLGHDSVVYITDQNTIASLTVVAGTQPSAFNPTNGATYTFSAASSPALTLPETEVAQSLAELGTNLAVGCWLNNLYFWNRTPISIGGGNTLNSFFYPVILPENNATNLLTINNLLYVFCGVKGNIYVTNSSSITSVITIPDSTTQQIEPYYQWGDVIYLRGRVFFSVSDSNSKTGGIWSFVPQQNYFVDQDVGASLRLEAQNSYSTYAGMATLLFAPLENAHTNNGTQQNGQLARGPQYWAAWDDGTSGASLNPYGIDYSDTSPFTGGQTIVESDAIPIGTILKKFTPKQFEYKLSTALATGESVQLYSRTDINGSYVSCGIVIQETATPLSGIFTSNVDNSQWLQLKAVLTSVAIGSSPSFVRLKELRIR